MFSVEVTTKKQTHDTDGTFELAMNFQRAFRETSPAALKLQVTQEEWIEPLRKIRLGNPATHKDIVQEQDGIA
jgi:hypothetical protein